MLFGSRNDKLLGETTISCLKRPYNLNLKGTSETIDLIPRSLSTNEGS